MKKILSMLLVFCLVFVLAACSSGGSGGSDDYEDEDVIEEEVVDDSEDMSSGDVLELVSRGTWDTEDSDGYKVHGEIETTGLIRASDWGTVESTFNSFNCPEPLPGFESLSPNGANQDSSAILLGKIRYTNVTDGWDFTEDSPHDCRLYFDAPDLYTGTSSSLCVIYGSGMKKYDFGGVSGYLNTSAMMKSNDWMVPFVIVIPETFTPNEPDGSEQALNAVLRISGSGAGCEFTMPGLVE